MAYQPPHYPFSPTTSAHQMYPPRLSYPYPSHQQQPQSYHHHHRPPPLPPLRPPKRYSSQPVLSYAAPDRVSRQRSVLSEALITHRFGGMSLEPGPSGPQLLSLFDNGNTIVLQAVSSQTYLSIKAGEVETSLEQDRLSQFIVHVKRPGVVALQNIGNDSYLAIYGGSINGAGRGGPYCEFLVGEIDEKTISLESTKYPGQRIGVTPEGAMKAPVENDMGDDIRFVPVVVSYGTPSLPRPSPPAQRTSQHFLPQPQDQTFYPSEPPPYPGPPPSGYIGTPPVVYPASPPVTYVATPPVRYVPQGPQVPYGYNVMDAFKPGNDVQLISKATNNPVTVVKGKISANGIFGKNNSSFTVFSAITTTPGAIMLQNCAATGLYLAIGKSGHFMFGKGHKESHLKVIVHSDSSVSLQSVLNGSCISFGQKGQPLKSSGVQDRGAQFRVRLEKQVNTNSQIIMTQFGRPSIANQLRAGCVIQLYLKGYNNHLGVTKLGNIVTISDGGDSDTFFRVIDRGMGVVSLDTYKYCQNHLFGFRLTMKDGSLCGRGPPDLNSDFLLKENVDGTVCFESATYTGSSIGIDGGGLLRANLNIYLVTFENIRGSNTITRTPLN